MEISAAKEIVIKAGKQLLESGLIARTWGNISCRVNDSQFVITPSGRSYDSLTPDEIVLVNINDLSYNGNVKPSSEKGIHASCYKLRDNINFVIHTHQVNASVVSVLNMPLIINGSKSKLLGNVVPNAAYGLPGTKKLCKNVGSAISSTKSKAVIMARHGALCMGEDYDEAFAVAASLEAACADFIAKYKHVSPKLPNIERTESERNGTGMIFCDKNGERNLPLNGALEQDPAIHAQIYNKYPGIINIIHSDNADITEASLESKTRRPFLDDFAQLIGTSLKCADESKIVKKLKGRNAVLLKNGGGYCCAGNKSDAQAVEMVLSKGCKTYSETKSIKKVKPINPIETFLMRFIYLKKYSKQAQK